MSGIAIPSTSRCNWGLLLSIHIAQQYSVHTITEKIVLVPAYSHLSHFKEHTAVLPCQPTGYSLKIFWIYSFKIWDLQVRLLANRGSTVWQVKYKKFVFWCEGHTRWYLPLPRSAYLIGFFLQYQNPILYIVYVHSTAVVSWRQLH
jgi:hypothetical protein